jgi:hypothetical protein
VCVAATSEVRSDTLASLHTPASGTSVHLFCERETRGKLAVAAQAQLVLLHLHHPPLPTLKIIMRKTSPLEVSN